MMPSAPSETAAKWQLRPGEVVSVVSHRLDKTNAATKASYKLCAKWQEKLPRSRNFKDALIRHMGLSVKPSRSVTWLFKLLERLSCMLLSVSGIIRKSFFFAFVCVRI